ncbi:hypothetical protein V8C42DRAFT_359831 [Trichoderma barbatum]
MASIVSQNTYRQYKQDTQQLLFWIIHAFNTILQSSTGAEQDSDEHQSRQNVTGQVTVRELLNMARTISKHAIRVPGAIYRKLQSVTRARTAAHEAFQLIAASNPGSDPGMEESNASHKHFIDALHEVFEVLGGPAWARQQHDNTQSQATGADSDEEAELDADVEKANFSNKFAALDLRDSAHGGPDTATVDSSGDEESDVEPESAAAGHQRRQTRPGRGKKKKKKGGKRAKKSKQVAKSAPLTLDEVPLESYCIIEDKDGIITDYLLAVFALFEETCDLRLYMSRVWHDVAYGGLNSAVAATLADLATAMIKRTESAIMVEFPGHESYETVMQTITRGDVEKAQGTFTMILHTAGGEDGRVEMVEEADLDVREQFLIYAYWDLVDFVTDFQATRSGKPTKRMLEEIDKWDPTLDLQRVTKEQRHHWRRSYTINWLYDLVNLYSGILAQHSTIQGEHHMYEKSNWTTGGLCSQHVRLFGINELASIVTSLAMQKPGTDVKKLINPSLVFQLQCIVDSLTVSRGWSFSIFKGHVLEPPMSGFRPRRDFDLFLDLEYKKIGTGLLQGADVLIQLLERDSMLHNNPSRHEANIYGLQGFLSEFRHWLGESKYMSGLKTLPPSRFSNSNSNGLWEYSPFLCGAGLTESLEVVYRFSLKLWDQVLEPMLIVHLHNMLVQKKYLERPIGLFASLAVMFPAAFFVNGRPPTSNFSQALCSRIEKMGAHFAQRQRATRKGPSNTANHGLDMATNCFFSTKSNLLLYRESGWNPDRIQDGDLGKQTWLFNFRSKHSDVEPSGQDASKSQSSDAGGLRIPCLKSDNAPVPTLARPPMPGHLSRRGLLELIRRDVYADICGRCPYSSLNYIWVLARIMILFTTFEDELKRLDNPTYHDIYVTNSGDTQRRVFLAIKTLSGTDEECLRVMAKIMEEQRTVWIQHIYWESLDSSMDQTNRHGSNDRDNFLEPDMCSVM